MCRCEHGSRGWLLAAEAHYAGHGHCGSEHRRIHHSASTHASHNLRGADAPQMPWFMAGGTRLPPHDHITIEFAADNKAAVEGENMNAADPRTFSAG